MKNEYYATITWKADGTAFTDGRYSRAHIWAFDCGIELKATASPHVVPLPYSQTDAVDPEEAYVASLSSCHMLTFLHVASKKRFKISEYVDAAVGYLEKNEQGKPWVARVLLRPRITFDGTAPAAAELAALHHVAHEECFIANSVKTDVKVEVA